MTTCEIIVIEYGLPELEEECIASVEEHTTDVEYVLTVHDNYEADEGLAKVWNSLIRESEADFICLLNNDTRVEEGWLWKLLECFEDDEELGIIGPMTNSSTGPQGSKKYRTKSKRLKSSRYPLVGFCMVFPRKVWEEAGGFDEEYEIYGEDSDFCMEVRECGYKWLIRTDVFIFHHGKSSTPIATARGKDILSLKKKSKDRFLNKWKFGPLRPAQLKEHLEIEAEKAEKARRCAERAEERRIERLLAVEKKAKRLGEERAKAVEKKAKRLGEERAKGAQTTSPAAARKAASVAPQPARLPRNTSPPLSLEQRVLLQRQNSGKRTKERVANRPGRGRNGGKNKL